MKTQQLDENTKAIIIEVMDIFYELDVEEIPEDYPEEKEKNTHVKIISQQLKQARQEGFNKYILLNSQEAKAKGQDLGINGMYLIVVKKA